MERMNVQNPLTGTLAFEPADIGDLVREVLPRFTKNGVQPALYETPRFKIDSNRDGYWHAIITMPDRSFDISFQVKPADGTCFKVESGTKEAIMDEIRKKISN